ncbi:flagellar protein FlbD [mine drainage metagenome]|uniref:Flagellar protein FlbD n=1 Tax=mine drainage metagenome TaxID=410659 RepID=A0A1J5QI12_9ZZZZ
MIVVTRLNGPQFAVNPDLLQRIESAPDTILTLIDGTKYIVEESVDEVIVLIQAYRAQVIAQAQQLQAQDAVRRLEPVHDAASDERAAPLAPPVQLHPRRV